MTKSARRPHERPKRLAINANNPDPISQMRKSREAHGGMCQSSVHPPIFAGRPIYRLMNSDDLRRTRYTAKSFDGLGPALVQRQAYVVDATHTHTESTRSSDLPTENSEGRTARILLMGLVSRLGCSPYTTPLAKKNTVHYLVHSHVHP